MRRAPSSNRRTWLAQAVRLTMASPVAGVLLVSSGCGFKLRRGYDMAFKTIQLTGFAGNSPMAAELARALEASGVTVVDSTLAATQAASASSVPSSHIVFEAVLDQRDMVVSTTTAYGQIRDMTARNLLRFQVKRGDGTVLLPAATINMALDLTYNESDALAKQDEVAALHKSMQSDIVNQLMRRLAAIRPDQLTTPPEPLVPSVVHAPSAPDTAASR